MRTHMNTRSVLVRWGFIALLVLILSGCTRAHYRRQADTEVWLPSQKEFIEVGTDTNATDYQARRLQTRVRRLSGEVELVHTNDATAFSQRPLIAILENYQQEDGSIEIPKVLRPYMGGQKIISRNR